MPRSKKDKRAEILRQDVGPGGSSSPAIDAMLSDAFVEGTNKEAVEIAAAVVKLFGGQMEQQNNLLAKMMERMDQMDKTAEKYESDRKAWRDEVLRQSEKLKMSDAEKEKLQAKAATDLQAKVAAARAQIPMDRKMFEDALRREPQEVVTSGGVPETIMEGGVPVAKLFPEELRVKHLRFILMPGVPTKLPQSIANMWRAKKRSEAETVERQAAMKKNMEVGELDKKMKEIDAKYHSSSSHLGDDPSEVFATQ